MASAREFGEGPLGRAAAFVYTLLVVELLFLLTTLPGLVPLVLLDRDASNLPLVAACALPVGPALAAALYALHHRSRDLTELHPAAAFWRGYRVNLRDVLRVWVPCLVWLTIIAVNLAHFTATGVPGWWAVLLIAIAAGVTLWMINALVIASLFTFRLIDLARLSGYFLTRTPGGTVGNVCLLIMAGGITVYASEAALVLLGSPLALMLLGTCHPMIVKIKEEFTV